jgi:hypothetical protein
LLHGVSLTFALSRDVHPTSLHPAPAACAGSPPAREIRA